MPKQYACIGEVTVGAGGASTITFNSIPATYTDLVVKISARGNRPSEYRVGILVTLNGSSASLTGRALEGSNGSAYSYTFTVGAVGNMPATTATSNTFGSTDIYIPNYTSSNNKSFSGDSAAENNSIAATGTMTANLWSNSAAVTSVTLTPEISTFAQYSVASLYGITNS